MIKKYPVSIKGVVSYKSDVLLLRNEREEWELPGGKMEGGEDPKNRLQQEILEESGIRVNNFSIIDCWVYTITKGKQVFIVTYGSILDDVQRITISDEHNEGQFFPDSEIANLNMPQGYKKSIGNWIRYQNE